MHVFFFHDSPLVVGKHVLSEILYQVERNEELRVGGVCQLLLPQLPPDWLPAAAVSPGCSSVLQLLRFLKCHLCLMEALISCIRKKHTPVVSGYIWSRGSVPRHTHAHAHTHALCQSHPSQACSLAVGPRVQTMQKRGTEKNQQQQQKNKNSEWTNYLMTISICSLRQSTCFDKAALSGEANLKQHPSCRRLAGATWGGRPRRQRWRRSESPHFLHRKHPPVLSRHAPPPAPSVSTSATETQALCHLSVSFRGAAVRYGDR